MKNFQKKKKQKRKPWKIQKIKYVYNFPKLSLFEYKSNYQGKETKVKTANYILHILPPLVIFT